MVETAESSVVRVAAPVRRRLVGYALAGGVAQLVYLGSLAGVIALGGHYLLAVAVAQCMTIAFAFPTYRRVLNPAEGRVGRQFVAFLGVWWAGATCSLLGVPLLVEAVGVHPVLAQVVVMVVVALGTFTAHLRVTFAERGPVLTQLDPASEARP